MFFFMALPLHDPEAKDTRSAPGALRHNPTPPAPPRERLRQAAKQQAQCLALSGDDKCVRVVMEDALKSSAELLV